MEEFCKQKCENIFFHNVEPRFKNFKNKMKTLSKKNNIIFDEDVFMDTLIKCSNTFSNKNATNEEIDNYFWVAFKQNNFSNFSRNKFNNTVNLDDFEDSIHNDEYNNDIDEIVKIIKNEVKNKFGENLYRAWILHVCNNYTYKHLENEGFKNLDLHNELKKIKRFVLMKLSIKNKNLNFLLKDNNFL